MGASLPRLVAAGAWPFLVFVIETLPFVASFAVLEGSL